MTVAWLVSVMMVTLLDALAVGMMIYVAMAGAEEKRAVLASYALHAAAVTGAISLLLAAATFKLRDEKPPPKVTTFAVTVAVAPIIALILATLRG